MGQRYQAIFKYLAHSICTVDKNHTESEILTLASHASRIILCTPTDTHFNFLEKLIPLEKPILCEKPITKKLTELEKILLLVDKYRTDFSMTFQYSELVDINRIGKSHYNYFRSGADGLFWDCLQIIALAKGDIEISNDSPIWRCMINGQLLSISEMDSAYVSFVRKWITGQIRQNPDMLFSIHQKTERLHNERQPH